MQAAFICMAHNLIGHVVALGARSRNPNEAEIDRKSKVLAKHKKNAKAPFPKLYLTLQRFTQHSVKLIRWFHDTTLEQSLPRRGSGQASRALRQIMTQNFGHRSLPFSAVGVQGK